MFHTVRRLNALLDQGRLDLNYADSRAWNALDAAERFTYPQPYLQVRESPYFLDDQPARHLPIERMRGLPIDTVRGCSHRSLDAALGSGQLSKLETSRDSALPDRLLPRRVDTTAQIDAVFDDPLAAHRLSAKGFAHGAKTSDAPLVIKLQGQHADQLPSLYAALQALVRSGEVERIRRSYLRVAPIQPGRATGERRRWRDRRSDVCTGRRKRLNRAERSAVSAALS